MGQVAITILGLHRMWSRLGSRVASRSSASFRRSMSTTVPNAERSTRIWPWIIGSGLVAGSAYYFMKGPGSAKTDPIKTAADIINVS